MAPSPLSPVIESATTVHRIATFETDRRGLVPTTVSELTIELVANDPFASYQ